MGANGPKVAKRPKGAGARPARNASPAPGRPAWLLVAGAVAAVAVAAVIAFFALGGRGEAPHATAPANANAALSQGAGAGSAEPQPKTMETGKPVVVQFGIAFDQRVPTVAQVLTQIERRHAPDDGEGRTFAVLDADGWSTPDGQLHLELRISSEEPGLGSLVYRPTGQVLWSTRVVGPPVKPPEDLTLSIEDEKGQPATVDGSTDPPTVIAAKIRETGVPVKQMWPVGAERHIGFRFSACGCYVEVRAKREGDRLVRLPTTRKDGSVRPADLPVIFPDDPDVAAIVNRLMQW